MSKRFKDSETWDLQDSLIKWLYPRLKRFKVKNTGIPNFCMDIANGNNGEGYEIWNEYLSKWILALEDYLLEQKSAGAWEKKHNIPKIKFKEGKNHGKDAGDGCTTWDMVPTDEEAHKEHCTKTDEVYKLRNEAIQEMFSHINDLWW